MFTFLHFLRRLIVDLLACPSVLHLFSKDEVHKMEIEIQNP